MSESAEYVAHMTTLLKDYLLLTTTTNKFTTTTTTTTTTITITTHVSKLVIPFRWSSRVISSGVVEKLVVV